MHEVIVPLGERSYAISIGSGTLGTIGEALSAFDFSGAIALVSNPTVYELYGSRVRSSLASAGFRPVDILIPDGEEYKSLDSLKHMYDRLLEARLDRRSAIVALGGGVIGDIAGLAASTYMRGISFVQVPTTLLAQVDSSVGGKTGINHPLGKNMIGTFWQPRFVLIDVETLTTLPEREFLAGCAEVIKYGVIRDSALFQYLQDNRPAILRKEQHSLVHIIARSCANKAEVVASDEREAGLRAILNYGHTVGHALETTTDYRQYLHGEAVAIGMHVEACLAAILGIAHGAVVNRQKRLLADFGLPWKMPDSITPDRLLDAMELDKKTVSGSLTFVLPRSIGDVEIRSGISASDVEKSLKAQ